MTGRHTHSYSSEDAFKLEVELIDKGIVDLIARRLRVVRQAEFCHVNLHSDANVHETQAKVLRYANQSGAPVLIVDAAFVVLLKVMQPTEQVDDA